MPKQSTKLDQKNLNKKRIERDTCFMSVLYATRWTVRGDDLISFIENYTELMDFWNWSRQATSDNAKIQGVEAVMRTF